MAALPALLAPRRGRSCTRKDLPNALVGAGSATHVPHRVGCATGAPEAVAPHLSGAGKDLLADELYICLAAQVVLQMGLAQLASELIFAYLALVRWRASLLRGKTGCCNDILQGEAGRIPEKMATIGGC